MKEVFHKMKAIKELGPLHHVVDGDGPPVILIHGISASQADWWRIMPLLVSAGYRAIAVDLLGHGDSPKPQDPQLYSAEAVYTALENWIDELGLDSPFYLVGHSLGGYMSLTYALRHPDRVRAMVLINPLFSLKQLTRMLDLLMPLASVGVGLLKATPQWLVNSFLSYNDSFLTKLDAETRWAYARDIKRASPNFLRIPATAPDLTPSLPSITPVTLVLWGVDDKIEKADSFSQLVSGLFNATGKGIAGCGHHPHQGKPELVSRMLLDFFKLHPVGLEEGVMTEESMQIDPAQVAEQIEEFIRRQVDEFQRDGVVVAMSGGLDSAVVAGLATRALGPERVKTLLLPERDSSPDSRTDALLEIERLGLQYEEVSLTPMLSAMGIYGLTPLRMLGIRRLKAAIVQHQHRVQAEALGEMPFRAGLLGTRDLGEQKHLIDTGNAYTRIKHRMRMVTLYYYADLENRLVLGTTNKSEFMTGFVVKWGDNVADIEPLLPLYKTQVRQLASYLGVSEKILDKPPSPDLIPGIVDGLALGMDYETLDRILWGLELGGTAERIVETQQVTAAQVEHVREMQHRSEHLRELPPYPDLEPRRADEIPASSQPARGEATPSAKTARQLIEELPQYFRPDRARGANAVIQFQLSGEDGGNWYAVIKDGTCTVTEGVSSAAQGTIRMSTGDYVDLASGKLGGARAFMTGRVKTSGNATLLRKMQAWFPR
jgi:NAD+ synthase